MASHSTSTPAADDNEPDGSPDDPGPYRPRKPVAPEKRLAQQAGICCADPLFWKFLAEHRNIEGHDNNDVAAGYVRWRCNVKSRRHIALGNHAGDQWRELHADFIAWRDHPDSAPSQRKISGEVVRR